jgi:hypothetical protein
MSPLPLPDKPSIAVLPFANMGGDPEQEYFADGMVEEINTAPSRIRWLLVLAPNSTCTYKGQPVDVKQVGRYASPARRLRYTSFNAGGWTGHLGISLRRSKLACRSFRDRPVPTLFSSYPVHPARLA